MIVTAALLYGEGDFGRSMCLAVEAAFDTDCNAATVGSLVGMSTGFSQIPASWYDPFEETLQTTMPGLGMVKIEELATQTMALMSEKA